MCPWRVGGVCGLTIAFFWVALPVAGANVGTRTPAHGLPRLDVPFIPQDEALCGGAALAMVLRYWGEPDVWAEDFAELVEPERAGIRTGALVGAVEARGWTALALQGTPTGAREQLARGRPLIALIRTGSGTFHYVVLVGWAEEHVVFHDPKVGPFRTLDYEAFTRAWSAGGNWALLILPPPDVGEPDQIEWNRIKPDTAEPGAPDSGQVPHLVALAGSRFRAGDWAGAGRLAEQALALDPADTNARRLLAGSSFLSGNVDGALRAWNYLDEPKVDLTRIDGLVHIRYDVVANQLEVPHGRLMTPGAFRRARRRLADVPAVETFRLGLRPRPGGIAQVDVALVERPLLGTRAWDAARIAARAVVQREIVIEVASPTGNGERWAAGWRWWNERPRLWLSLALPAVGGRSGLWQVEGFREEQAYALAGPRAGGPVVPIVPIDASAVVREERRRTALSFADWVAADLRLEIDAALDTWAGRGSHLSLTGRVETRRANDHLALGAEATGWRTLRHDAPFSTLNLFATWTSAAPESRGQWLLRADLWGASTNAPLDLWQGAGTGEGRDPLLRAHPLLDEGVIDSPVFGRRLISLMIERQEWSWRPGPLQLGWALFIDTAEAGLTGRPDSAGWLLDGGAGLRLRSPSHSGLWRLDVARGLVDGHAALSLAWQGP